MSLTKREKHNHINIDIHVVIKKRYHKEDIYPPSHQNGRRQCTCIKSDPTTTQVTENNASKATSRDLRPHPFSVFSILIGQR
jgi:hypothetical protein